jgi:hypothetical protein
MELCSLGLINLISIYLISTVLASQLADCDAEANRAGNELRIFALLLGGFVIFLFFGLGITDSDEIAPGAIVVFATILIISSGLMA